MKRYEAGLEVEIIKADEYERAGIHNSSYF